MGAVAVGAVAAGAGAGLSAYGAIKSAKDQAEIDNEKAGLENEQADEVIARNQINDAQIQQQAYRSKLDFGSAYAASGHEGTGIGSQLEIQRQADVQQALNDREAEFQARMLRAGAGMEREMASKTISSGYLNAASSILGGANHIASSPAFWPSGSGSASGGTQALPAVPKGY